MRTFICLFLACGCLIGGQITPASYVATPGGGGTCSYTDETGTQLTDGVLGSNYVLDDLGNGCAYEWVGWFGNAPDPQMTFSFAGPVSIDTVQIGFAQDTGNIVFLPLNVDIGGSVFPLTGSEVASGTRGWVTFTGSWTGSSLGINLTQDDARWTFIDEISFFSAEASEVPEPATMGFVALGCALLLAAARRHKTI